MYQLTGEVFAPGATGEDYQAWVTWNPSAAKDWHTPGESKVQKFKYIKELAGKRPCVMLFCSQR